MTVFLLNLYPLLVEAVFGSLLVAGVGIAVIILIIGFFTKMSPFLIMTILFCFTLAYAIGYAGALLAIITFIGGVGWLFWSVYDFMMKR